jgi:hypothetical protein
MVSTGKASKAKRARMSWPARFRPEPQALPEDERKQIEWLNDAIGDIMQAAETSIKRAIADPHRAAQQRHAPKGGQALQRNAERSLHSLREKARELIAGARALRKRPIAKVLAHDLFTFASTKQITTVQGRPYSIGRLERIVGQEITATRRSSSLQKDGKV